MIRRDRGLNLNTNWIFLNRNACRNTRITSQGKISGLYFYEIIITIPPSFHSPQGRDHKTGILHSVSGGAEWRPWVRKVDIFLSVHKSAVLVNINRHGVQQSWERLILVAIGDSLTVSCKLIRLGHRSRAGGHSHWFHMIGWTLLNSGAGHNVINAD